MMYYVTQDLRIWMIAIANTMLLGICIFKLGVGMSPCSFDEAAI